MKKFYTLALLLLIIAVCLISNKSEKVKITKIKRSSHSTTAVEAKLARAEYFNKLLRDPISGKIPQNIRSMELEFANNLQSSPALLKKSNMGGFHWKEAGPVDVGGRTRALGIDKRNNNIVLAGGVSGGIWKTTDKGASWSLKSKSNQNLSVTTLVQDPREGFEDTWYYGTGEWFGGGSVTTGAGLDGSYYFGSGVYRSTDNGETWTQLSLTAPSDPMVYTLLSHISKIVISPTTGTVFFTTNGGVLCKLKNDDSFEVLINGANDHYFMDVDVSADGKLLVACSEYGYNKLYGSGAKHAGGIYKSTDDGNNFVNITPQSFTETYQRTLVKFAPSNPTVAYVLAYGGEETGGKDINYFYKIDVSNDSFEDRSSNLPSFDNYDKGYIETQGNYNYILEVKPDDENFVLVGGTNLYRSENAFAQKPSGIFPNKTWIGGYEVHTKSNASYANHHADQHSIAFDPNDPKICWSGHDGGLSYTTDITRGINSISESVIWEDKNNNYNVTQFYSIAIAPSSDNNGIIGGTQDNGSPFFEFNGAETTNSIDVTSGDGSFCYWGNDDVFAASQYGHTYRIGLASNNNKPIELVKGGYDWDVITPITGKERTVEMHFINPFAVDPSDEKYVYFISKHQFWRNDNVRLIQGETGTSENGYSLGPTDDFWTKINEITGDEYTAVSCSRNNSVVYLAISGTGKPKIVRYDNAKVATSSALIKELTSSVSGANISSIAINPENSSEILVVVSNYKTKSIFHSIDAGNTFTEVEGNLGGDSGPSVRAAEIVVGSAGVQYLVGTSIGLFSTYEVKQNLTNWTKIAEEQIGSAVVSSIKSRVSDNKVAVGTHGRGAFIGIYDPSIIVGIDDVENTPKGFVLSQNYPNPFNPSTTIKYTLPQEANVVVEIFNINGQRITKLVDETQSAGEHKVVWNSVNDRGSKVSSGIYFYRIKAGDFVQTRKMSLLK
ncbi:MAG: T9SS type A sorting domain-containing protein [Rhodothermaceae bacterium]